MKKLGRERIKKDTALTMAMNKFKGGLRKVSSKMSDLKTSLATIVSRLAVFSNTEMRTEWTRVVEDPDSEFDSRYQQKTGKPLRKKKGYKGPTNNKQAKYLKGDKFVPGMKWQYRLDREIRKDFNKAKRAYEKKHPANTN